MRSRVYDIRRSARWWGALLIVLAPVLFLFVTIAWLGVNTLIADEFHYVEFIRLVREGGQWSPWIWLQHNEHRVVPMKLVMALLQGPTRWSQLTEMLCSGTLSALLVLVLWYAYRSSGATSSPADLLVFAPISLLVSSLSQYENQFFGMMMCHYFTALGTAVGLWLLARGGLISTVLAWLAAIVGAISIGNGFLVFPAGIAVLAAQRASWMRWGIWLIGGLAVLVRYMWDYITPPHTRPIHWTIDTLARVVSLGLTTLGAPLAAGSVEWAVVAAIALSMVSSILLMRWMRAEPHRRTNDALAVSFLLFGLGSAGMVAVGRIATNGDPLGSRYITYTNLAWVGAYLLVIQHVRNGGDHRWRIASWSLLLPGLLAAAIHGFSEAGAWHKQRLLDQYVLQTYYLQPDSALNRLGSAPYIRQKATYLRGEGLSAFAAPQRIVMLMDASRANPSTAIVAGQAVEQHLVCPVEELYDVGVMLLPAARPGIGTLVVTVSAGKRQLASRLVEPASIRAWTWLQVPLAKPLRQCTGTELVVRVESQSAEPGGGLFVLAAPASYEGTMSQSGVVIPERRLGMALNAFHYGLLP